MRINRGRLVVWLALAALIPVCPVPTAHAQPWGYTEVYWSGDIYGDTFYVNQADGAGLCHADPALRLSVSYPNGGLNLGEERFWVPCNESQEWDFVIFDVSAYGTWGFQATGGNYDYGAPSFWTTDFIDYASVLVKIIPSSEYSMYAFDVPAGAVFEVRLESLNYFTGYVTVGVSNVNDGCYALGLPGSPQVSYSGETASVGQYNLYEDTVVGSGGTEWVDYYNQAVLNNLVPNNSCGWSATDSVSFAGTAYYSPFSVGQSVNGTSTTTTRDGASHTASWN